MKTANTVVFEKMLGRKSFFQNQNWFGGFVNQLIKNKRPKAKWE